MIKYYLLSVNSLIKTFSVLDAGNKISFGLSTQDSNNLFSSIQKGDMLLGYIGVPINKVKYLFSVEGIQSESQLELIKQLEVSEGTSLHDSDLEREISVSEIVEIDKNKYDSICKEMLPHMKEDSTETEKKDSEIDESKRVKGGKNILLYGVPGSGKSWTIANEYCEKNSIVERLVFHPDYTNADFIGQLLPDVKDDQVTYRFKPGPFTAILKKSYNDPEHKYILIIEEINRGNAPAIFGEVFQLLDRKVEDETSTGGFPMGTSEFDITHEEIAKIVYDNPECPVRIPSNLFILSTMNTSDQNVFTLDTAFQRRWSMRLIENSFENVHPSLADAKILDTDVSWKTFCETINKIIIGNKAKMASAEDKRLGVYFIHKEDLKFDDRAIPSNIETPLLSEYNALVQQETIAQINAGERSRLSDIREATMNNRLFPEKVIKYLWDDAFKFNPEALFDADMDSLEKVIRTFIYSAGHDRFKIFKQSIRDELYAGQK